MIGDDLRWEDERYVRVFTRDTAEWMVLSWDAQALYLQLTRKVDRAGLVGLGRVGKRGVAVILARPGEWDRISPALDELLEAGAVRMTPDGTKLLIPNHLERQEARASDRARQAKSRELARDLAAASMVLQEMGMAPTVSQTAPVLVEDDASVAPSNVVAMPHPAQVVLSGTAPAPVEEGQRKAPRAAAARVASARSPSQGTLLESPQSSQFVPESCAAPDSRVSVLRDGWRSRWVKGAAQVSRTDLLGMPLGKGKAAGTVDYSREGSLWKAVLAELEKNCNVPHAEAVDVLLRCIEVAATLRKSDGPGNGNAWRISTLQDLTVKANLDRCLGSSSEPQRAHNPRRGTLPSERGDVSHNSAPVGEAPAEELARL